MPILSKHITVLASVIGVCATISAAANEPNVSERLTFDIMLGGFHIGDVLLSYEQSPTSYESQIAIRSHGVVRWFQDFQASMQARGSIETKSENPPRTIPDTFSSSWKAREIAAIMNMRYDPTSRLQMSSEHFFNPLTGEDLDVRELPWFRDQEIKAVPNKLRSGALDPISAFVAARSAILIGGQSNFRIPIYDGRRRYDLLGEVDLPETMWIRGSDRDLIRVRVTIEPLFGFDEERTERMQKSSGRAYFTPDDRFLPTQIVLNGASVTSVMNLTADCHTDPVPCDNFLIGNTPIREESTPTYPSLSP